MLLKIIIALLIIIILLLLLLLKSGNFPNLKAGTPSHPGKYPVAAKTKRAAGKIETFLPQVDQPKLIAFLEEADNAYIRAYQYKSLGSLPQYTTRELTMELQQKITYYNNKIWGTPAYRNRAWTIVSINGESITVRKELTFKNIKYGRTLVKLGDDCVEYWKVILDELEGKYRIQEITC